MGQLAISLLGPFTVTRHGQPVTRFGTDKTRALLAYLVMEADRAHRRARLAGLLWPDFSETDARHNLSQALLMLRKALDAQAASPPFLLATRQTLRFNPDSDVTLDVVAFQTGLTVCQRVSPEHLTPHAAQQLTQAVAHYQGEFLSDPWQVNSQAFEEWMLLTRVQLYLQAVEMLDYLVHYYMHHGEFALATTYARRQLELEPLHEVAHRQLMTALAYDNRRPEALAQYAACQSLLARELGIEPAPETTALYAQIREGGARGGRPQPIAQPHLREKLGTGPLAPPPVFVGRARELTRLDDALTLMLQGRGQVRLITGEAGSGKTALLNAFARRALAARADVLVVNGSGNAYTGLGDPYWPFIELLRQLWLPGQLHTPVDNRGTIANGGALFPLQARRLAVAQPVLTPLLAQAGPDLTRLVTGRGPATRTPATGAPATDRLDLGQTRVQDAITRVLHAVAAHYPLVLMLDDLQWADQASLNLLFHLSRRLAGQRLLIVGAFRANVLHPDYRPSDYWDVPGAPDSDQPHPLATLMNDLQRYLGAIQIDLTQAAGRDFIDALLDSEPNHLDAAFRETLYRHTGGHALFATELLRGMQERGELGRDAQGYWSVGEHIAWDTLPARVEGVIAERAGQLLPDWQAMLAVASIEGDQFTAQVVARVLDLDEDQVNRRLSGALSRHHYLVAPVGIEQVGAHTLAHYHFRHLLFQKYLYDRLNPVERAQGHLHVGQVLESLYAERAPEISLHLARHFELGGDVEKAAAYLLQAGQRATRLAATEEALRLLTYGLALLKQRAKSPARDRQEVALQLALGAALLSTGWAGEARGQAAERAYALCQRTGDPEQVRRSLLMLAYVNLARDQLAQAAAAGEQLDALAQCTQDPLTTVFSRFVLGSVHYFKGDLLPARQNLEQAVALYDAHTPTSMTLTGADVGVSSLVWLGEILWVLGYADQALARNRQAVAWAQALEHTPSLELVLNVGALSGQHLRRDTPALRAVLRQVDELSRETSSSMFRFWGTLFQGWLAVVDHHDPSGLAQIQEAIRQWEATGTRVGRFQYYMLLAEAYLALGQVETARATLARVLDEIATTGHHFFEAEILRLKGKAGRALGRLDEAETCFRQAIAAARKQSAKAWELRAMMSLCRLYQATGQADQLAAARAQLAEVYGWFTEGLDTADLQEAAALVRETCQVSET